MISSAIWNKWARVNFSKTVTNLICSLKCQPPPRSNPPTGGLGRGGGWHFRLLDLLSLKNLRVLIYSQIAREKSCDYLLIIYMQQFWSRFDSFRDHILISSSCNFIGWKCDVLIHAFIIQAAKFLLKQTFISPIMHEVWNEIFNAKCL